MDIHDLGTQVVIVLFAVALLWLLFKALKWIWRITLIVLIFLALSFILPAVREWIFGFF
jgi:hypothetical protein